MIRLEPGIIVLTISHANHFVSDFVSYVLT